MGFHCKDWFYFSDVDCRKFIEKNCLGLAIASLTSHEDSVRSLGATILSTFRGRLEESKFIDKQQVMCMLDALKNGMEGNGFKLSSIVSVFLIRASSILLKPGFRPKRYFIFVWMFRCCIGDLNALFVGACIVGNQLVLWVNKLQSLFFVLLFLLIYY